MPATLLHLQGVSKDFAKINANAGRIRLVFDLLLGRGAAHVFTALDNVSFDLAQGESLGIVGENGAGKSTLLKVVANVITPTRGTINVSGRVGAPKLDREQRDPESEAAKVADRFLNIHTWHGC